MNAQARPTRPTGVIIYQGPSRIDGAPIVAILTGITAPSTNAKTGAMPQLYIIRADMDPVTASRVGADASICGSCAMRHHTGGPCYVLIFQGPLSVYRGFERGIYPSIPAAELGAFLQSLGLSPDARRRWGAYGDPGALPAEIADALSGDPHTAYSHQWRTAPHLRQSAMASVDTLADARDAWADGWRTFRVVRSVAELTPGEILCPASREAGYRTTCAQCGLCDGARPDDARKSIAIVAHGARAASLLRTV